MCAALWFLVKPKESCLVCSFVLVWFQCLLHWLRVIDMEKLIFYLASLVKIFPGKPVNC